MRTTARCDPKCEALRAHATFNLHPEQVTDALFQTHPFFDARDLMQVRYEMLRRVLVEGQPVGATAVAFGFSRVTLFHLRQRFAAAGLAGLLPQPKGPQRAHKLSAEVVAFVLHLLEAEPALRMAEVPQRVAQQPVRSRGDLGCPCICAASSGRLHGSEKKIEPVCHAGRLASHHSRVVCVRVAESLRSPASPSRGVPKSGWRPGSGTGVPRAPRSGGVAGTGAGGSCRQH
jgi:helix-turn-helix protein